MIESVIRRAVLRRYILGYAAEHRHKKFTRVASNVFELLDAKVKELARKLVMEHPSKGKTITYGNPNRDN